MFWFWFSCLVVFVLVYLSIPCTASFVFIDDELCMCKSDVINLLFCSVVERQYYTCLFFIKINTDNKNGYMFSGTRDTVLASKSTENVYCKKYTYFGHCVISG